MNGEIAKAVLDGAQVTVTTDCWPCRGPVGYLRVSMTKQTSNGVATLSRRFPVGVPPEQLDEDIARTVGEMAAAIELPHNWRG